MLLWFACFVLSILLGWVFWFFPESWGVRKLAWNEVLATTSGPAKVHVYWVSTRWFDSERGWYQAAEFPDWFGEVGWEGGWWAATEGTVLRVPHNDQPWGLFGSTRDWLEDLDRRAFAISELFETWHEPFDLFPASTGRERATGWPFLSHTARALIREGVVQPERSIELPNGLYYGRFDRSGYYGFPIGIIWIGLIGNSLVYTMLIWALPGCWVEVGNSTATAGGAVPSAGTICNETSRQAAPNAVGGGPGVSPPTLRGHRVARHSRGRFAMSTTTEAPIAKGLDGVIAGETAICNVEQSALIYRGYEIADLAAHATFEETAFLLLEGHKPSKDELKRFKAELVAERDIPEMVKQNLRHAGDLCKNKFAVPMDILRTAVSVLGHFDPDCQDNSPAANLRKAKRILAKVPTIIGHMQNNIEGRDFIAQDPEPVPRREPAVDDDRQEALGRGRAGDGCLPHPVRRARL
jgi:hypothetical protein